MVLSEKSSFNGRNHQTRNSSINARSSNVNGHVLNDSSDEEPYDHGNGLDLLKFLIFFFFFKFSYFNF